MYELRRLGITPVPMNPMTAIGFIIICMNLIVLNKRSTSPKKPIYVFVLLAVVVIASVSKLIDIFYGTSFNIDSLFYRNKLVDEPTFPNRMAPNTALSLFLLSLSVVLLYMRSQYLSLAAQTLAICVAFLALFALIGYAYHVNAFFGIKAFTPMALSAAVFCIMLSMSILYTHPHVGFMRFISNNGPSGHMAQILLPSCIIIPLGLGWLRLMGQEKGWYDLEFGTALLVALNILIFFILICICASFLHQTNLQRIEAEKKLAFLAGHDPLTGLMNRRILVEQLTRRLSLSKRRPGNAFAVFYIDLDGFKNVNDTLGHAQGDALLIDIAETLRKCVRASDNIARLGGDEFAILFEEMNHSDDIIFIANKLLKEVPRTLRVDSVEARVGLSVGVASGSILYASAEDILQAADAAMYKAKKNGKGRYELAQ